MVSAFQLIHEFSKKLIRGGGGKKFHGRKILSKNEKTSRIWFFEVHKIVHGFINFVIAPCIHAYPDCIKKKRTLAKHLMNLDYFS